MFKRSGSKVKTLAKVLFVLQIVFSCLIGVGVMIASIVLAATVWDDLAVLVIVGGIFGGILYIALGILFAWLSVLVMYAVGESAEKAEQAAADTAILRSNLDYIQQQLAALQAAGQQPSGQQSADPAYGYPAY